jgi:uncharacterized Zn finger protein
MSKFPDTVKFCIKCPKCGQKIQEFIGWLKEHPHLACRGCGVSLDDEVAEFLRIAERAGKQMGPFINKPDAP